MQENKRFLDPWRYKYADRSHSLVASEIRALFEASNRPEVISLAGGMPQLRSMPFKEISEVIADVITEKGEMMWQYGSAQGNYRLRELVLDISALEGVTATPDNVVITSGSQQALDYITRIFINPGDVILAEAPNYVGALGVFRSFQAEVANVAIDDLGLVPDKFEKQLKRLDQIGKRVKFLYTVPNFHNPSGVTLANERRPKVLEICKKYDVLIVEDNPYGLLSFDGDIHLSLYSYDYDAELGYAPNVVYLGSFSKIMAPGFRVGWSVVPKGIKEKLVLSSESAILCPSNASQMTLIAYLENFDWKKQIETYRNIYKERHDAMVEAIRKYLPYCDFHDPSGGFYIWLKVPEHINTKHIQAECIEAGVAYVPGRGFFATGEGDDYMRLSFCFPTPAHITEGVRRLATVLDKYVK
jgi:DNA-binding transcriptional MocR family regulator